MTSAALLHDCAWYAGMLLVALLAVGFIVRASPRAQPSWKPLAALHRDQIGAVQSLSFVLTLPIFVLLMLFIVQLSQLTIARIVLEFAAFAAARSAIVWIPADVPESSEAPNCIGPSRQLLGNYRDENDIEYTRYGFLHPSRKLLKIELAAAQALMPICPSRAVGESTNHPGIAALPALQAAYLAMDPSSASNGRIPTRLRNKLNYALTATRVEVEARHKRTEPPLTWHDLPPYRAEFEPNEIGWHDQILVTVRHDFALLPGPGRFLSRPSQASDPVADRIQQRPGVFVYPMSATVRLSQEGEKPVLTYSHSLPFAP